MASRLYLIILYLHSVAGQRTGHSGLGKSSRALPHFAWGQAATPSTKLCTTHGHAPPPSGARVMTPVESSPENHSAEKRDSDCGSPRSTYAQEPRCGADVYVVNVQDFFHFWTRAAPRIFMCRQRVSRPVYYAQITRALRSTQGAPFRPGPRSLILLACISYNCELRQMDDSSSGASENPSNSRC